MNGDILGAIAGVGFTPSFVTDGDPVLIGKEQSRAPWLLSLP